MTTLNIGDYYMLNLSSLEHNDDVWLISDFIEGYKTNLDGYIVVHFGSVEKNGSFQRCLKKSCQKVFIPVSDILGVYPLTPEFRLVYFNFQSTDVDGEMVFNAPNWIVESDWFFGEIEV